MSERPIGFLVWCPEHGPPTVVHGHFIQAVAEADRLKHANPTRRFVVMSPVEDQSGVGYALGWDRGRAEGLCEAHRQIMDAEARRDVALDKVGDLTSDLRGVRVFRDRARAFQAIVADCLLWFDGFAAAHSPKEAWERPHVPDRERLRELNAAFQEVDPATVQDEEIPFQP